MSGSTITGKVVDVKNRRVFSGEVQTQDGRIKSIREKSIDVDLSNYIMPGFIDAHVHVESSMLIPSEFARMAVRHGTVGAVSDPHEIANVLGKEGVRFMAENGGKVPFKFSFGAPSSVPATYFEATGSELGSRDILHLFREKIVSHLGEVMNVPGVLSGDRELLKKISIARAHGCPVDGHAPGLTGDNFNSYMDAGITTDHECFSLEEAREKAAAGMKILIREGSAAKNFEALIPLIKEFPDLIMLCSDDKHPDDLKEGHINQLVSRVLEAGYDLFDVLKIATSNSVEHYNLEVGLLQEGDPADFIVTGNLESFQPRQVFIDGERVFDGNSVRFPEIETKALNNFNCRKIKVDDLIVETEATEIRAIEVIPGELVTRESIITPEKKGTEVLINPEKDLLKLMVLNRYHESDPAVAFISKLGLKRGAIASSVSHDSHNIIAAGCSDEELVLAVNTIVENGGGIAVVDGGKVEVLPLPVAGLMSLEKGDIVAGEYERIDNLARELGTELEAPFMTLSFMALLVIPELKLSDQGLFDGRTFSFVPVGVGDSL